MEINAVATALLSVVFIYLPIGVFSSICYRLNPLLFERCINLGYNYTASFPNDINFQEKTLAYQLEQGTRLFKQCSRHLDIMLCAIYVPKCVEGVNFPVLPCREVCEDFVRDCEAEVVYEKIEWIKGLCRLLPSIRKDRKCLRPANYKPRDNITAPILQNCAKLRMSSCSHLNYTHTTQSSDLQFILDNVLKGKNFGNHSTCSSTIKNILCAEFAPPCFPEHKEKIVLQTVCKSDCENVRKECPELYSKHFSEHSFCELMATEKSDLEGFCKLTKWPTAVRWPTHPNLTEAPTLHSLKPTTSSKSTTSSSSSRPSSPGSPSTQSSRNFPSSVPSSPNVPLHAKASTPVVVTSVCTVILVMAVIGIVFSLMLRKRRRCYQGWSVRGYREQLNELETTVSLRT